MRDDISSSLSDIPLVDLGPFEVGWGWGDSPGGFPSFKALINVGGRTSYDIREVGGVAWERYEISFQARIVVEFPPLAVPRCICIWAHAVIGKHRLEHHERG